MPPTQRAPQVKEEVVAIRVIEAVEEDECYQLAVEFQKLMRLATLAETTAAALKARITNQLRAEGMDAATGGLRGMLGESSDAARTAAKVTQPLLAIASELENVGKNAHVFRNRLQALVFDAIREHDRLKKGQSTGLKVNR